MQDVANDRNLIHTHKENAFAEFDRDPLIPHMVSTEGPALAVADINHDGADDVFIGSARGTKSSVFIQTKDGTFKRSEQPVLDNDSNYEDVDACWADVNTDGHIDLIVASGGNEYYGMEVYRAIQAKPNRSLYFLTQHAKGFPYSIEIPLPGISHKSSPPC